MGVGAGGKARLGGDAVDGARLAGSCTKTALAMAKPLESGMQLGSTEGGEQHIREVHLCIGHLPQQKVADADLAAGADQQIGFGQVAGAQVARERSLVQFAHRAVGVGGLPAAHGLQDIPAAAVVDGDAEREAGVAGRQRMHVVDHLAQRCVELRGVADDAQLHAFGMQLADFFAKVAHQQLHQARDFVLRAAPVLGAEGEQSETLHACIDAGRDDLFDALGAGGMAHRPGQRALSGPAAVAVHDDGNVSGRL